MQNCITYSSLEDQTAKFFYSDYKIQFHFFHDHNIFEDLIMLSQVAIFMLVISWFHTFGNSLFADFFTVQKLNAYLEQFFAKEASITAKEWFASLPTDVERLEMKKLLKHLHQNNGEKNFCSSDIMVDYPKIAKFCNITLFKDVYCLVHEHNMSKRFWGYAIITRQNAVKLNVHHSVAHYESDGDVCNETATIFEKTKSKALVVNGANRYAVIDNNVTNQCQPKTPIADAAHNDRTMFQAMNEALFEASVKSNNDAVFIQWHGMSENSCPSASTFISAGLTYNAPTYQNPSSPVIKLMQHFNKLSAGAMIPNPRSACHLLGTNNVFGRYVNGVPTANVCRQNAVEEDARGVFVHIEQKRHVRDDWELWTRVIENAFEVSSASLQDIVTVKLIIMLSLIHITYLSWLKDYDFDR